MMVKDVKKKFKTPSGGSGYARMCVCVCSVSYRISSFG